MRISKAKALAYARALGEENIVFVVEATGFGRSLVTYLRSNRFDCRHDLPQTSKLRRAAEALPCIEEKRVRLYRAFGGDVWIPPLLNEVVLFPRARYDDQVDALVQLIWFAKHDPFALGRVFFC